MDGAKTVGTSSVAAGTASVQTTYNAVGTHSITATYSGDTNHTGSASSTFTEHIANLPVPSTTKVATSGSPVLVGQSVTFTASVSSTYGSIPDGEQVTFYDGTVSFGTSTTTGGVAAITTSSLAAKSHTIKATYSGDSSFKSSSGTVTQIVDLCTTATNLSSNPNPSNFGAPVDLTAVVTSTASSIPTGTVTFKSGSATIGTATLSNGTATLATAKISVGSNQLTATYSGDSVNGKGTSTAITQSVNQAITIMTLESSPDPSRQGQSIKLIATLTSNGGIPTGTVTFKFGTTTLGTANIGGTGQATLSTNALPHGADAVTAAYTGNTNYSSTSATMTQTVN